MNKFQIFPKQLGVFPYIFLIYLVMPLFYVAKETGIKEMIGYALILLFLVAYRQLYSPLTIKPYSYWLAVQISIIVILSFWYDPNNLFLGFFPANFIGWFVTKKYFYRALISFMVALSVTTIITAMQGLMENTLYFFPFLIVMFISPFGIRSINKRMELEKELDQANAQIKELIKREERVRIARDLHDTLGHTLSLITLQSQLVQRLAEKWPEQAKVEAKEIEITSRSALSQVRELVSGMRAITIADELADMQQIFTAANISFQIEGESNFSDIPLLQQNILGMCLREATTNIVKHSAAKNCFIIFYKVRGNYTIVIEDDGIGLICEESKGNGLKGMKERLALIEGELTIESKEGTTLTMNVPVIIKQEKEGIAL
ncbi:sensor histidine kinase [Lederbergia lenta]|uniref:sensor histidine kinase n=1 Tax=Lederbergia lenta TaxID=1467 RepID=UPI00203DA531|nr:sensor histidine kinase [Lederbergia lenta]MCM3112346.1 sensor histidine kinase [Lederbergia lenta]